MQGKKTPVDKSEMAIAMLKAGKTYREIRGTLGIGISTIHSIAKEMGDVDYDQIVKEIKSGYVARHLMLAEYLASGLPKMFSINANIKDVAIAMGILTDKAMKMEYTINEQKKTATPIPQAERPGLQAGKPITLAMDSTGKTSAIARPQSEQDKLIAEAERLLEECHPPEL